MVTHLVDRIRRYAARHALWTPDTRVVAAVSGGSDSIALVFLLRELAAAGALRLAGLAHLNHRIRGVAADEDAAFCRALAERLGLPSLIGDEDVPARAARARVSVEVAGRAARQAFYAAAIAKLGGDAVALAHTRDDQAETVLLRLVRGAGTAGLGAMAPRSGPHVRPLLEISRAELRAYLHARGEGWREDLTNRDRTTPRNLLRHDVLPILRSAVNPQVDAALARAADILRADAAALAAIAEDAASRLVHARDRRIEVESAGLAALPLAIARRVALCALATANPGRSYGLAEADALCRTAAGEAPVSVAGIVMERSGAAVVLMKRSGVDRPRQSRSAGAAGGAVLEPRTLSVPGELAGPDGAWVLTADGPLARGPETLPVEVSGAGPGSPLEAVVDAARIGRALRVRGRRPGDRLRPLGAPGHRKLQDVLVDRKVPCEERDRVPIVTDEADRIVWVAGHALAEPFRVTPRTTAVVVLRLRQGR